MARANAASSLTTVRRLFLKLPSSSHSSSSLSEASSSSSLMSNCWQSVEKWQWHRLVYTHRLPFLMDHSPFKQNLEKNRNRQKYHHILKEHPTFTKIVKFGCEML